VINHQRVASLMPVTIWSKGTVACTSRHVAPSQIEITLAVNGITIERDRFHDVGAAMAYALTLMHSYTTL